MAPKRAGVAFRFWPKVNKTDSCWLWMAGTFPSGYGAFVVERGKTQRAHRVAYELTNGPIPEGLLVLHNCPGGDNPLCVNPAHLWLGDALQNAQDRDRKGRGFAPHHRRSDRLTTQKAKAIRSFWGKGLAKQKELARIYSVSAQTINNIVRGRQWTREGGNQDG